MDVFSLINKTILVSGASSGIGRQTAISAAEAGATVIITGRNPAELDITFSQLKGSGHIQFVADLLDEAAVNDLVDKLPVLHGLVHSAGLSSYMPANLIAKKHIEQLFGINYNAIVLITGKILQKKKMAPKSSIVFLSSIATKHAYFAGSIYSSTKAALEAYSKTLALELAPKGIRSNCLAPSFVKTRMVEESEQTISPESMEKMKKMHPLGFGEPEDVANTVLFFLSDASRWISGVTLPMGGI